MKEEPSPKYFTKDIYWTSICISCRPPRRGTGLRKYLSTTCYGVINMAVVGAHLACGLWMTSRGRGHDYNPYLGIYDLPAYFQFHIYLASSDSMHVQSVSKKRLLTNPRYMIFFSFPSPVFYIKNFHPSRVYYPVWHDQVQVCHLASPFTKYSFSSVFPTLYTIRVEHHNTCFLQIVLNMALDQVESYIWRPSLTYIKGCHLEAI